MAKTHTVRTRDGATRRLSLDEKTAIRCMCMECGLWELPPSGCTRVLCPLWPFRGATRQTLAGDREGAK